MRGRWARGLLRLGAVLGIGVLLALGSAGCFGGGPPSTTGAVDGFVFKPQDDTKAPNALRIVPTPTPPAGYEPCAGAQVSVTGSATIATTGSNGYFRIDDVSPGYQTVTVVYGAYRATAGVWVQAGKVVSVNPGGGIVLPKKWTVMVYMCADNNLDAYALEDMDEMERVGSSEDLNILVQIDRWGSSKSGDWSGARRYYVTRDMVAGIHSTVVDWFGPVDTDNEIDMGDPETLREFVEWATSSYPAEHYMLVLWNHGDGWTIARPFRVSTRAICFDDASGTQLDVDQVRAALEGTQRLDIIGLDACLMQMIEIAYEFRGLATIMVGSEETEPDLGWDYEQGLEGLRADPAKEPWDVATDIVDAYAAAYSGPDYEFVTQSAFGLDHANEVTLALKDLKITLAGHLDEDDPFRDEVRQAMVEARDRITRYGYDQVKKTGFSFYDVYDFCETLSDRVTDLLDDNAVAQEISRACAEVQAAIDSADTYAIGNGHGLSIYIPPSEGPLDHGYDWLQFDYEVNWSELFGFFTEP